MKKLRTFILIVAIVLSLCVPAFAADGSDVSAALNEIMSAKLAEQGVQTVQEFVDKLAEKPAAGNEWWILAIRNRYEDLDYRLYREALEKYAAETPPSNATSKERVALTLLALESDSSFPSDIIDAALDAGGINNQIFGLYLLHNGASSAKYTEEQLKDLILDRQCTDGGWSLSGENGDEDISAMTMQCLSLFKDDPEICAAMERCLKFLSGKQLETGGYVTYCNYNPETSAQVVFALSSLGIEPYDERFVKSGNDLIDSIESFRTDSGCYAHTEGGDSNQTSQVQIFYCYTAYEMFKKDGGHFYDFGPLSEKLIEREGTKGTKTVNLRLMISAGLLLICIVICVVRFAKGERKAKKFISTALIFAVLIAACNFINIQSTDNYYKKDDNLEKPIFTTISIYCYTVAGREDHIPADGKILEFKPIQVNDGDSIYDQLVAACKEYKIHMESDSESYINAISNLYEKHFGDLSGWMFKINGEFSSVGCNQIKLSDGDYVEWVYTLDLGKDVGNEYSPVSQ